MKRLLIVIALIPAVAPAQSTGRSAIDRVNRLDFLTVTEKQDIFYGRFRNQGVGGPAD